MLMPSNRRVYPQHVRLKAITGQRPLPISQDQQLGGLISTFVTEITPLYPQSLLCAFRRFLTLFWPSTSPTNFETDESIPFLALTSSSHKTLDLLSTTFSPIDPSFLEILQPRRLIRSSLSCLLGRPASSHHLISPSYLPT